MAKRADVAVLPSRLAATNLPHHHVCNLMAAALPAQVLIIGAVSTYVNSECRVPELFDEEHPT